MGSDDVQASPQVKIVFEWQHLGEDGAKCWKLNENKSEIEV